MIWRTILRVLHIMAMIHTTRWFMDWETRTDAECNLLSSSRCEEPVRTMIIHSNFWQVYLTVTYECSMVWPIWTVFHPQFSQHWLLCVNLAAHGSANCDCPSFSHCSVSRPIHHSHTKNYVFSCFSVVEPWLPIARHHQASVHCDYPSLRHCRPCLLKLP